MLPLTFYLWVLVCICFGDLEKIFDSIPGGPTWGVPESVLRAVRLLSASLTPPGLSLVSELVCDID